MLLALIDALDDSQRLSLAQLCQQQPMRQQLDEAGQLPREQPTHLKAAAHAKRNGSTHRTAETAAVGVTSTAQAAAEKSGSAAARTGCRLLRAWIDSQHTQTALPAGSKRKAPDCQTEVKVAASSVRGKQAVKTSSHPLARVGRRDNATAATATTQTRSRPGCQQQRMSEVTVLRVCIQTAVLCCCVLCRGRATAAQSRFLLLAALSALLRAELLPLSLPLLPRWPSVSSAASTMSQHLVVAVAVRRLVLRPQRLHALLERQPQRLHLLVAGLLHALHGDGRVEGDAEVGVEGQPP